MDLYVPDLQHAAWLQGSLLTTGVLGTPILVFSQFPSLATPPYAFLLGMLGLIVVGILIQYTPFLAFVFPHRSITMGDLVKCIAALNHGRLAEQVQDTSRKSNWDAFCQVIVLQTGVKREQITLGARIVDDLGIY